MQGDKTESSEDKPEVDVPNSSPTSPKETNGTSNNSKSESEDANDALDSESESLEASGGRNASGGYGSGDEEDKTGNQSSSDDFEGKKFTNKSCDYNIKKANPKIEFWDLIEFLFKR